MGRRSKLNKSKTLHQSDQATKEDLPFLVDRLLRICTQPNDINVQQALEVQKEIESVTEKINLLESHRDVNSEDSSRVCATIIDDFTSWAKENGAKFEGCEIKHFEDYELGLMTNVEVPESSLVLSVPRDLMMTVETVNKSNLRELFEKDQILKNMPNVCLSIFLLYEKFKRDSFWKPYINILPKQYSTVLYFSSEELEELKGSPTLEIALKQVKSIARQYGYFYKLFHTSPDPVSRLMRGKFTFKEYRWAVSTVMTRQNSIPSEDGSQMINALIPLWDLCNHTNGTVSTDYNPDSKQCECLALRRFEPGEQFFIFYGARTNSDLFIHNGFVYEDNFHDGYWLRLGISKSDKLRNKRTKLLQKLSMSPTNDYFIFKGSTPIDEKTLAFLRIFNMEEADLDHWLSSDDINDLHLSSDDRFDIILEKKSWNFLITRFKLLLALYSTTLEEDVKLLEGGNLNRNRHLAIRMRICEKKVLKNAIQYAEKKLEQLGKV